MLRVKTTVADISLEACGARSLSRRRRRRRAHDRDPQAVLKTPAAAEKSRLFIALVSQKVLKILFNTHILAGFPFSWDFEKLKFLER